MDAITDVASAAWTATVVMAISIALRCATAAAKAPMIAATMAQRSASASEA